ncbi:MAG: hypothetical protein GF364_18160 [Candidatus Lokiarchaeota archaeon]|nr:hypothetical protein [Candidatus Lokiarchaeota archaeon]
MDYYEERIEALEKYKAAKKSENIKNIAQTAYELGTLLYKEYAYDQALEVLSENLDTIRNNLKDEQIAETLKIVSERVFQEREISYAIELNEERMKIAEKLEDKEMQKHCERAIGYYSTLVGKEIMELMRQGRLASNDSNKNYKKGLELFKKADELSNRFAIDDYKNRINKTIKELQKKIEKND